MFDITFTFIFTLHFTLLDYIYVHMQKVNLHIHACVEYEF